MHPFVILDVFTDTPLEGNQLAVFTEASEVPQRLMQRAARELNFSETVFLLPPDDPAHADAHIRIFTPATELPFAGHPTLGSAYVVGEREQRTHIRLQTGVGVIAVVLTRDGDEIVEGEMEQPIPTVEPFEREAELLAALGLARSALPVLQYCNGPTFVHVTLDSHEDVAALRPDMNALMEIGGATGVSCSAVQDGRVKTRMFAPGDGVAEDPATGSAAGPLALHLARHGLIDFDRQVEIEQGAEVGRPSLLKARVDGGADHVERIAVAGSAVVVAHGEYRLQ